MSKLYNQLADGAVTVALLSILAFQWPRYDKFETEKGAVLLLSACILFGLHIARWQRLKVVLWNHRSPIILGVVLLVVSASISTGLSLSPVLSLWGTPVRGHGLVNLLAYMMLFIEMLFRGQHLWRIITVNVIISALMICLVYNFMRINPYFGDTGATTLNHNVMASWLVMAFFVIVALRNQSTSSYRHRVLTALLVLIILTLILSGSRGAILGLAAGLVVFHSITLVLKRERKKQAVYLLIYCGLGIVYVLIGASLREHATGFWQVFQPNDEFRQEAWQAAITLVNTADEPFLDGEAHADTFSYWRSLVGYGPDALEQTQSRFGVVGSGHKYLDRFHNHIYDAYLMQGILGLIAWFVIYVGIAYQVLVKFHLVNERTRWLWLLVEIISVVPGVLALRLLMPESPIEIFVGPGIGLGLIGGLILWTMICNAKGASADAKSALIALFSAVVAHWVDLQFGFMRVATETLWWVLVGVMITQIHRKRKPQPVFLSSKIGQRVILVAGLILINSLASMLITISAPLIEGTILNVLVPTLLIVWAVGASKRSNRIYLLIPVLWTILWLLKSRLNIALNALVSMQLSLSSIEQAFVLAALTSVMVFLGVIGFWGASDRPKLSIPRLVQIFFLTFLLIIGLGQYSTSYIANALHAYANAIVDDSELESAVLADVALDTALRYTPTDPHLYIDQAYALTRLVKVNTFGAAAKLLLTLNNLLTVHPFHANTLNWQYFQDYYLEQTSG